MCRRTARFCISPRAMRPRPGTCGSAWKLDSCSVIASTEQRFSVLGRMRWAAKAAWMSVAQPLRSLTLAGSNCARVARTCAGVGSGAWRADCELQPARASRPRAMPRARQGILAGRASTMAMADMDAS